LATTQPVREFISSGEAEQQVSDDGTFRKLFLDALAGKEPDADANHDGYVTGTELGLFLQQKMTNFTNNRQTPRYGKLNAYGYDRGDFVFQVGKPDAPVTTSTTQPTNDAAQAWAAAQNTTNQEVLEDFIRRYGGTFYGTLAWARLDELKKSQEAAGPSTAAQPPKPVENTQVAVVAPPATPADPCSSQATTVSLSSRSPRPLSANEECALKPKDVFKECEKCPEMLVVPAGSFTMGAPDTEHVLHRRVEGPQHKVVISKPFAVGKFHITVDQFAAFVKDTGYDAESKCSAAFLGGGVEVPSGSSIINPGFPQTGSHPAVCLNWDDAKLYVAWLSKKTGKPYRLLTEAEWEYAARAGTSTIYFFGNDADDICRYGNGDSRTVCSDGYAYTAPVGIFLPNDFGLYDMHGNAWQWVEDCWHRNYQGAPVDGSAWASVDCEKVAFGSPSTCPPWRFLCRRSQVPPRGQPRPRRTHSPLQQLWLPRREDALTLSAGSHR
jgi:formylglycine-generating enzyme required for sulfatase activity